MALLNVILAFVVLAIIYKGVSVLLRNKLLATLTAVNDIPLLGIPRQDHKRIPGSAVICGGSISGLLSARVCSDHFENVVMVEPEESVTNQVLGDEKSSPFLHKRSRIFQYTSFHGYQFFMTLALRKLFNNFDVEVEKAGGRFIYEDGKVRWSGIPILAPWHKYTPATFPVVPNLTRAGFESVLRRLVLGRCPNVRYMTGTVTGLVKSECSPDVVHSVTIRSREGGESTLLAPLVVDCTGPAIGGYKWLQKLSSASTNTTTNLDKRPSSFEALKVTYDPKMAYSTCTFNIPPTLIPSIKALGVPEDFENSGYLFVNFPDSRVDSRNLVVGGKENNLLQFVCGGWDVRERMKCTGDMKNFISQMKPSRPLPDWLPLLLDFFEKEQVPATYVHARCPPSVYVQYHLANNLPNNFVAIGDSVLQLNPLRGHGSTKACVDAVTLNALLTKCASTHGAGHASSMGTAVSFFPKDFGRTFFSLQAKRTGGLWQTYKLEDYAWQTTTPAKGDDLERTGAWRRAYGDAVLQLALKDREVYSVSWHVNEWLAPPTDLLSPLIVLKLLWMKMQSCLAWFTSPP